MIICRECKKELDETNFSNSHLKRRFCKKCAAEYNKIWRNKNKEYDKKRKIVYSKNNPEKKRDRDYRYDKKNRARYLSRSKIRWATRTQKIKRPNKCDMCGCICKPDGHHQDYNKPFDVLWLCKGCHLKAHNNRFAA